MMSPRALVLDNRYRVVDWFVDKTRLPSEFVCRHQKDNLCKDESEGYSKRDYRMCKQNDSSYFDLFNVKEKFKRIRMRCLSLVDKPEKDNTSTD